MTAIGHLTKVIKVEKRNDEGVARNKDCETQS